MTLVVLKLCFHSRGSSVDGTIGFAEAEMIFQSSDKEGQGPEVVAWGPFRHPETWNRSTTQNTTTTSFKADLGITSGVPGPQVSGGTARETETSWEQVYFDKGSSTRLFNHSTEQPHGVRWSLTQNQKCQSGVDPEIRVAVLISRAQSSQPYLVTFRIATHRGTLGALMSKGQTLLGMRGGKEVRWRASPNPSNEDTCYDEGRNILDAIDPNNLEQLMDPNENTSLKARWLRPYRFEIPNPGPSSGADTNTAADDNSNFSVAARDAAEVELGLPLHEGTKTDRPTQPCQPVGTGVPATAAHAKSSAAMHKPEDHIRDAAVPSLFLPPSGADHQGYSRLLSLEVRAMQAEARLAAQDIQILKLQQDMARLKQLVSAGPQPA